MSRLSDIPLTLVDSFSELERFWRWLGERRPLMAIDVETTGLSLTRDHVRLAQFGDGASGWALPFDLYKGVVKEAVESYHGPLIGHHLKFDAGMLAREGIAIDWTRAHDSLIMCFLNSSLGPKGLKPAAGFYIDSQARAGQQELKETMARNGWDWATIPFNLPVYWAYAAGDTVLTALLAEKLWKQIQPYREAYDLEMACQRILCEMELRGVRIDVGYCEDRVIELEDRLARLVEKLSPLNPNSPHQVAVALQGLGVELTKRTKSGKLSVDDDVLHGVLMTLPADSPQYELATLVSQARDTQKLLSAFFRNFLYYRDDDILRCHFNQLAAKTGRMSVSEPALQQVPKQSLVRDAFIPRKGNRLIVADYDNEELRVAAHFSRDPSMLAAFAEGRDLHAETARRLYHVDEPTEAQRAVGKRGMFSKAYGAGIPKFARTVGLSEAEAGRLFQTIDEVYPGLLQGMANVTRVVRERAGDGKNGYVILPDGRRLEVPKAKAYVGFNYLIQGASASVMKQAMVDLDRVGLGQYLNLTVHDEVMLDVPEAEVEDATRVTVETMRRDDFASPLTASAVVLDRWGDKYRKEAA